MKIQISLRCLDCVSISLALYGLAYIILTATFQHDKISESRIFQACLLQSATCLCLSGLIGVLDCSAGLSLKEQDG